jgi:hypothetical protein
MNFVSKNLLSAAGKRDNEKVSRLERRSAHLFGDALLELVYDPHRRQAVPLSAKSARPTYASDYGCGSRGYAKKLISAQ